MVFLASVVMNGKEFYVFVLYLYLHVVTVIFSMLPFHFESDRLSSFYGQERIFMVREDMYNVTFMDTQDNKIFIIT